MRHLSARGRSGLSQEEERETTVPARKGQARCFIPPIPPGEVPHRVTTHEKEGVRSVAAVRTVPRACLAGAPG